MRTCMLIIMLCCPGALAACDRTSHLFITTPEKMEALVGSCLQIPCNFSTIPERDFNSAGHHIGIWIKSTTNKKNVVFDSSKTNKHPIKITGDLSQRDCTTLFFSLSTLYTDRYFFRYENKQLEATASCNPVQVIVKDFPPSPRIKISPEQLKEKESVTIICSAVTPCPESRPKLTWNLQQNAQNSREKNTDRTFTTKIQQIITVSHEHDGYNISCSAAYPVDKGQVKTSEANTILSVLYAPKHTSVSVSPSGWLSAGIQVNLTCSSRAKPPVSSFTWFQIRENRNIRVAQGDVYSFVMGNSTEGGYYCEATNKLGTHNSPVIQLNIEEPPSRSSLRWEAIVGGVAGVVIFICLVVLLWYFMLKYRFSKHNESLMLEDLPQFNATKAGEDLHYGEIDFSMRRCEASSNMVQESGRQQDTVYSQVRSSKRGTHPVNSIEDIYAQVS